MGFEIDRQLVYRQTQIEKLATECRNRHAQNDITNLKWGSEVESLIKYTLSRHLQEHEQRLEELENLRRLLRLLEDWRCEHWINTSVITRFMRIFTSKSQRVDAIYDSGL